MHRSTEKCTARTATGRCKRWPTRGATVCRTHGAAAPQVRAAAAERVLDTRIRDTLARLGEQPVRDPLTALAKLAGEVLAFKDAVGGLVNRLEEIRYQDAKGGEQLRAEVVVFERAMDRAVTVLAAMARLKLDERLAAITEAQAEQFYRALMAGLAVVGVTGEAAMPARKAAARELRIITSEPAGDPDGA